MFSGLNILFHSRRDHVFLFVYKTMCTKEFTLSSTCFSEKISVLNFVLQKIIQPPTPLPPTHILRGDTSQKLSIGHNAKCRTL